MRKAIPEGKFLAANVTHFRQQEGLSLQQLAAIIGVGVSKIREIEIDGGNSCSSETLDALGEYFGVAELKRQDLTHLSRSDRLRHLLIHSMTAEDMIHILALVAAARDRAVISGHYRVDKARIRDRRGPKATKKKSLLDAALAARKLNLEDIRSKGRISL